MTTYESKYSINFDGNGLGFTVQSTDPNRIPVHIKLEGPTLCVENKSIHYTWGGRSTVGLFDGRLLVKNISESIMHKWEPDKNKSTKDEWKRCRQIHIIKTWALHQCAKAIAKRVGAARRELIKNANADYVDIQRSCFAALGKTPYQVLDEKFYENKYLVKDIKKYRAAALAVSQYNAYSERFDVRMEYTDDFSIHNYSATDWVSFFSNTNKPYTSLRKTLTALPGGIPHWLAMNFRDIHFERPIYDRLELISLLSCRPRHINVFMHATRADLRRAIELVATQLRLKVNFRKAGFIRDCVQYISDYPDPHRGRVMGLARKSIEFHRDVNNQAFACTNSYAMDTKTAKPPIELPQLNKNTYKFPAKAATQPKVEFLDTVQKIFNEGTALNHCVYRSYTDMAVKGRCYLFHIEYNGEHATAEVSPQGHIVQVKGPSNCQNKATSWGRRVLTKWAYKLKGSVAAKQEKIYGGQPEPLDMETPF